MSKITKSQQKLQFNDLIISDRTYVLNSIVENLNWLELAIHHKNYDLCKQYKDQVTELFNQYRKHHVI